MMTKDPYIYHRLGCSAIVFYILHIQLSTQPERLKKMVSISEEFAIFEKLGPRYFTIWNVMLEMLYIVISIPCDLAALIQKPNLIPNGLREFRYTIFSGLLLPMTSAVAVSFWSFYYFDRELIFPRVLDQVIPFSQNLMFHGGVLLYALWELVFLPKDSIKHGPRPVKYFWWYTAAYVFTLFYTKYVDLGVWCYKTIDFFEGTPLFWFPIVYPAGIAFAMYHAQWRIKDAVWRYREGTCSK